MHLPEQLRAALQQNRLIEPADTVLVAVSGGLDSMVLLRLLHSLRDQFRLHLHVGHFDHRMRPDSDCDAAWVAQVCEELQVACTVGSAPIVPRNEQEARKLRYDFLELTADTIGANRIATAHHADDQAETVLFRVLRGTGVDGLAGIPERRGRIVRPLLPFRRSELKRWAEETRLDWREDPSNTTRVYARNRIRLDVLPRLEAESPGASRALTRLARAAARTRAAWENALGEIEKRVILSEDTGIIELARDRLLEYHPEIRARLLRRWLARLGRAPGRAGTAVAPTFIRAGGSGSGIHLSGGLRAERDFGVIRLYRAVAANTEPDQPLWIENAAAGSGETIVGGRQYNVRWSVGAGAVTGESAGFDLTDLRFPLAVRGWVPGDRIHMAFGTKKLKKLFVEKRLGREHRRTVPVLVDSKDHVLWVVGLARSAEAEPVPDRAALCITVSDANSQ
jgi:tRNA(Ile)-lysidine synthase